MPRIDQLRDGINNRDLEFQDEPGFSMKKLLKQKEAEKNLRHPEDPYQPKLLTGYERQITLKQQADKRERSSSGGGSMGELDVSGVDTAAGAKLDTRHASTQEQEESMVLADQVNMLNERSLEAGPLLDESLATAEPKNTDQMVAEQEKREQEEEPKLNWL